MSMERIEICVMYRTKFLIDGSRSLYDLYCGSHYFCCTLGTDIIIWHGKTGKNLGHVDTNQLKNNMAAISPNGRFIAAAAFTADVKVSDCFIKVN